MKIEEVREATKLYPKFADGRINYSDKRVCFVLNCVVIAGNQVLLTKRSADVIAYPNTINGISGFIDNTNTSIEDMALNELAEELDAPTNDIKRLVISAPFIQIDDSIDREWHVVAVLVEFSKPFDPKINWENKSAQWYDIKDALTMTLMPGFQETLETALKLRLPEK